MLNPRHGFSAFLFFGASAQFRVTVPGARLIPDTVVAELRAPRAPASVRAWVLEPPPWIQIATVTADEAESVAELLDAGECAAIALAERVLRRFRCFKKKALDLRSR